MDNVHPFPRSALQVAQAQACGLAGCDAHCRGCFPRYRACSVLGHLRVPRRSYAGEVGVPLTPG